MGDVGARLASGSECPVIAAPRGYSTVPDGGLQRIGVGYNGSPEAGVALGFGEKLAVELDRSIRLIGAVPLSLAPVAASTMAVAATSNSLPNR